MGRRKKKLPCTHQPASIAWEERPKGRYWFGICQCKQEVYDVIEEPKQTGGFQWPQ